MTDQFDTRYVEERKNRDGSVRVYWIRTGFPTKRLDARWPQSWPAIATALNEQADLGRPEPRIAVEGTVGWCVADYREAEDYAKLADSTKAVYRRWLDEIDGRWGGLPPNAITRRVVKRWIQRIDGPSSRHHAAAVLKNVLDVAMDEGLVAVNPALRLKLSRSPARHARYQDEQVAALLEACRGARHGAGLRKALALLYYTGQRPVDVVRRTRKDDNGTHIKVVQLKTGKKLHIRCHRELRRILDEPGPESIYLCARDDGRPFERGHLQYLLSAIRAELEMPELQNRDFRETAVLKLHEVGCTMAQVRPITGHSESQQSSVLEEHYMGESVVLADQAIAKWEGAGENEE